MPAVISKTVLVLSGPIEGRLDAERVAASIARGLTVDGRLQSDACPLEKDLGTPMAQPSAPLEEVGFDRRMRAARALVIACAHLHDRTLAKSIAFEAATRARQAGVPAYAVTAHNELDPFEARIVDLQVILEANTPRALSAAGRKLAALV